MAVTELLVFGLIVDFIGAVIIASTSISRVREYIVPNDRIEKVRSAQRKLSHSKVLKPSDEGYSEFCAILRTRGFLSQSGLPDLITIDPTAQRLDYHTESPGSEVSPHWHSEDQITVGVNPLSAHVFTEIGVELDRMERKEVFRVEKLGILLLSVGIFSQAIATVI